MPGPVRKKDAERRRRNKDDIETEVVDVQALLMQPVEIPVADEDWEPLTREFYESFSRSGQAIWMEPTDWMTAYALMETLDRHLKPQLVKVGQKDTAEILDFDGEGKPIVLEGTEYLFEERLIPIPGGVLNAILKGLTALLATEGDRRRLRIELERKAAVDAALEGGNVVSITQNRDEVFRRDARGS